MCPLLGFAAEGSSRSRDDLTEEPKCGPKFGIRGIYMDIQVDIYIIHIYIIHIYIYMCICICICICICVCMHMYNSSIRNDNGTIIGIQWELTLQ